MQSEFPEGIFAPLKKAYESYTIPIYGERFNSGKGRSQSMGILPRRNYGVGESRNNDSWPEILLEARKLATIICPDLNYTTIMVNIDYQALPHRDKNNDGESVVVGFNDYEGGELVADGIPYSIRHRPFRFRASETLHSVNPISAGSRFSIVFFRPRFPRAFQEKYGSTLTYDQLYALIPLRNLNQPASEVRIPTDPSPILPPL
jgi:hypothetical protein